MRAILPCLFLLTALGLRAQQPTPLAPPLEQGHSHNDYWRPHPLFDGLHRGFKSVEADVFLVDSALLVGHDRTDIWPDRTLQRLYLDPLRQLLRTQKKLYAQPAELWLYVDFKSEGPATYARLRRVLAAYQDILSTPQQPRLNGVKVILTGGYPRQQVLADAHRLVYMDGTLQELQSAPPASSIPTVNGNWQQYFRWTGEGPMPVAEAAQLRQWNEQARRNGQKIRFWNLPTGNQAHLQAIWRELLRYPTILVGADELEGLKLVIEEQAKRGS